MTEAVLEREQAFWSQLPRVGTSEIEPVWMRRLRRDALASVREQGLPTTKVESWRHTDLASVSSLSFTPAVEGSAIENLDEIPFLDAESVRMVYSNGRFESVLSTAGELPQGLRVTTFAAMLEEDSAIIRNHLADVSWHRESVFNSLNLAFATDGAVIEVSDGTVVDRPIHVVLLNHGNSEPFMVHPRVLVLAGRNSQSTIIESHHGLTEGTCFSNPVTEIVASENATVDHYKLQLEGANTYHIGTVDVHQSRSASVRTGIMTLGGKMVRNETRAQLGGEGGYAELNGLYLVSGDRHVDNYTTIEHLQPHCSSRELYKGILGGSSRGVFRGRILVAEGAQKTDSKQTNNNLLLSDDALLNTKPQLEIYADDVKCTHGATIGQVAEEAMFYLRARGIGEVEARSILIYAFASEVIKGVKLPVLREQLDKFLSEWLSGGVLENE